MLDITNFTDWMTTINTFTGNQSTLGLSKRYINKFEASNFKLSRKFSNIFQSIRKMKTYTIYQEVKISSYFILLSNEIKS